MSIIKDKYQYLAARGRSLSDVVVLAQAWKKSHTFIRRHNWYADVLELDISTVDLEERLVEWATNIKLDGIQPEKLLLVPAPKNGKWGFKTAPSIVGKNWLELDIDDLGSDPSFDDWFPRLKEDPATADQFEPLKLRPLAHMSIRDQSLATALMMCLADAIETAQGDTGERDLVEIRKRGIVSYGNRLQCLWLKGLPGGFRAKFSWGNSKIYRQYFQDYRAFLSRPRNVCADVAGQLAPNRELFVASLDIKSFFDRIDRSALLRELRKLQESYEANIGTPPEEATDELFWTRAARIFDWSWREPDQSLASAIHGRDGEALELGLPQGMVASGFFSNAYLIEFDRKLRAAVEERKSIARGVRVLDYCRYVDDIRIVLEADTRSSGQAQAAILDVVEVFVTAALEEHRQYLGAGPKLELSTSKSSVKPYQSISAQSDVSALMDVLNAELSGTFDMESLAQAAGGFDGLLGLSEQIEEGEEPKPSRLALATISVPNTDVRDDTVKRFVATRLAQLLRYRLAMADTSAVGGSGPEAGNLSTGSSLGHEFESTARKLIKAWAENPALVLLLRCGMDLFPHPRLLAPVLEALGVKLFAPTRRKPERLPQVLVAEYVAADIFRAGAVETGFRTDEEYPPSVDIVGYREDLAVFARRVVLERKKSPWYLLQQAYLFLASIGDLSLVGRDKEPTPEMAAYETLQRVMVFEPMQSQPLMDALPMALIAQQLNPNPKRFGAWLAEGLRQTDDEDHERAIVTTVALNRFDLLLAALASRANRRHSWRRFVPAGLVEASRPPASRRGKPARQERALLSVMTDGDDVFGQENSLLILARALLRCDGIREELENGLSATDVTLICADWSQIQSAPADPTFLKIGPVSRDGTSNPLYVTPPWVNLEKAWLYGLGRILRAALTGEFDFTSRRYLVTEDVGRYSGLRSTWFKRRFGLLNSGRGLLDEPVPISPWLSSFLSTLLQWPGVEFKENPAGGAGDVDTPEELLLIVEARLDQQRALFGSRSRTPIYVVPTNESAPLQDRPLRLAIVQPLRPRLADFDEKDPTHWTPAMLAAHRRHLAEVCRLTHQKLRTWASAQPARTTGDEGDTPVVDIILFPELAVHPEHVFHLRKLSDMLRANVFAGLTFIQSKKLAAPINQGLWLVRTESPGHGRSIEYIWQGKKHPMKLERLMGVKGYRPHLTLVELPIGKKTPTRIAAAICYDATDLDLVADLRDKSDLFLVAAMNKDVKTFDNMVAALHFHMYQPVVLANSGEFGGSTAQAPLPGHDKLIAHIHGNNQVAVSVFEVDPAPFKSTTPAPLPRVLMSSPAGYTGRPS